MYSNLPVLGAGGDVAAGVASEPRLTRAAARASAGAGGDESDDDEMADAEDAEGAPAAGGFPHRIDFRSGQWRTSCVGTQPSKAGASAGAGAAMVAEAAAAAESALAAMEAAMRRQQRLLASSVGGSSEDLEGPEDEDGVMLHQVHLPPRRGAALPGVLAQLASARDGVLCFLLWVTRWRAHAFSLTSDLAGRDIDSPSRYIVTRTRLRDLIVVAKFGQSDGSKMNDRKTTSSAWGRRVTETATCQTVKTTGRPETRTRRRRWMTGTTKSCWTAPPTALATLPAWVCRICRRACFYSAPFALDVLSIQNVTNS